ncbi:MAG: RidA family protein [Rhodospirillales bacterium]|nr:RidA family protein [Rhodospirillales bacterium]MDE0377671.1 RidA family protein [Rhodospirillales bacterium]
MARFDQRVDELGITLPEVQNLLGHYVPYRISRNQVFIAGQVSIIASERVTGKLGDDLAVQDGYRGARLCALNILAQLRAALKDDIDRARAIELTGFVNAAPDFTQASAVMNGASDVLIEVLGEEKGSHARSSVGVASLPAGAAVGVKAVFEFE